MGCGAKAIQQSRVAQNERSCANRSQCLNLRSTGPNEGKHSLVTHLLSSARAARHNQNIETGAVVEGNIRDNFHAARGFHWLAGLRDQQHLERGCFLTATFFVQPSNRKYLEGATEIEDLYFIKNHDSDSFAIHSSYWEKSSEN